MAEGTESEERTAIGVPVPVAPPRPAAPSAAAQLFRGGRREGPASRPGVDLAPGLRIKQYELIRELGRGGMGVVYAARDVRLGRRVAMKFLRQVDREVVERFLVEARATAQCSHENIVILYEADEHQGMPYMVLEFLDGRTLRELAGPFGASAPLPPARVVELMLPVARALVRAHEAGIVHRDLKPENVLVGSGGQVKVLDFGVAKALGERDEDRRADPTSGFTTGPGLTLTREGALVGTLPYMSPEQLSVDQIDHRSDLFSVGMMMWELLAGRHPIEPVGADTLLTNLVDPTPMRSIRAAVAGLPEPLARAVDACLVKTKAQRLGSAVELVRLLEAAQPGRAGRGLGQDDNPYPGLTAFQEQDAGRFFGRDRDVARMVARIRDQPLTGIIGPSGVGKSSFVRAGVGPALKASDQVWDVVTLRPGKAPLAALAQVVEQLTTRPGGSAAATAAEHQALVEHLGREPGFLGAALRERATASGSHTLVFVDQFEELYTLVPDLATRRAFTAALAAVGDDPGSPLRVVVSMRSDFLDRVGEDPYFLDELARGLLFLPPPDRAGLGEALERPLELVGYRFEEPAIVTHMLDALASSPGALPLLQFAAARLWDGRDRDRRLLTTSSYQAIGGVTGALAVHADEVVGGLSAAAQRVAQRVFRQLVTPDRTRAIVELADLHQLGHDPGPTGEAARVVDQLVAARLLVVQTRSDAGGGGLVEIVHESLIDRWPTLRRWLDEDAEDAALLAQLASAAKQWDSRGRPVGLLWRGEAMEEARRFRARQARPLPARDQAFLDAVLALAVRGRRLRRAAVTAGFVVLAGIAAGAGVAYLRMSALRDEATEAADRAALALETQRRQEAEKDQAEAEARRAAEQAAAAARSEAEARALATQTGTALGRSKEELEKAVAELERTAAEARAARDRAEEAGKRAQKEAARAQAAEASSQRLLDAERAKVRELERERAKLTTKLSGR